jgi:hypothetical protein
MIDAIASYPFSLEQILVVSIQPAHLPIAVTRCYVFCFGFPMPTKAE